MKTYNDIKEGFFQNSGGGKDALHREFLEQFKKSLMLDDNTLLRMRYKFEIIDNIKFPIYKQPKKKFNDGYGITLKGRMYKMSDAFTKYFVLLDRDNNEVVEPKQKVVKYRFRDDMVDDFKKHYKYTSLYNIFYKNKYVTYVEIPEEFTQYKYWGSIFQDCSNLVEVTLPGDFGEVMYIDSMFQNYRKLVGVELPQHWGKIRSMHYVFSECESIETLQLPEHWGDIQCLANYIQFTNIKYITYPKEPPMKLSNKFELATYAFKNGRLCKTWGEDEFCFKTISI